MQSVEQPQEAIAEIDARLGQLLPATTETPVGLTSAMRYSALAPGKRLRPRLCMASAAAVSGQRLDALDAGCAIELVHCFSLIHDDLPCIDDDDLRRGRATCHVVFGEALAVLAGDALFSLAVSVAATCHEDAAICREVVRRIATATGPKGLVGGEVMDIQAEGQEPELEHLRSIHSRKTGALIAASCACGALVGGGSAESVGILSEFGEAIGLAFQIHDDVLNETSTPEELGKAVGSDREHKKMTYPALVGLEASKLLAEESTDKAVAMLDGFGPQAAMLRDLALYAVRRTN